MIGQEVGTADKIISDLLTFARIKSVDKAIIRLLPLGEKIIMRFYSPENIRVNMKLAQDLLPVMVDVSQIEEVLINLITNAYQAMPDGGSLIFDASQKKGLVCLTVADTGNGIAPENLDKLFEPLITTKSKGIGLGLTVIKTLEEANSDRISVKSEVGQGSEFVVCLPKVDTRQKSDHNNF